MARRSCFETQDRVGLTEAELIDVEVEELPLLQVGDVDAIVRLLDLQTGGLRYDCGEIDLPGEVVRGVTNSRVPHTVVKVSVSGQDLLGLLRHSGDQIDGEGLVTQVALVHPLVRGQLAHSVPEGGEVLCPPGSGQGRGVGLES
ncbi:hypothetical protein [Streptomyces sp. MMS24-I29]|uniref:hypothetical protein n=1 Tax=Streptomyces sp. MMS24-I29 TaxID=3351480 RepID=UPI003C7C599A